MMRSNNKLTPVFYRLRNAAIYDYRRTRTLKQAAEKFRLSKARVWQICEKERRIRLRSKQVFIMISAPGAWAHTAIAERLVNTLAELGMKAVINDDFAPVAEGPRDVTILTTQNLHRV